MRNVVSVIRKSAPQPTIKVPVIDRDRYKSIVGKRVKALRLRKGLTQETVAAALGVTRSSVCRTEGGETDVNVIDFMILASILGTTMEELIEVPDELIVADENEAAYATPT